MAGFEEAKALLHRIRVNLYPNYLEKGGKYIARTASERTVSPAEICGNLRERGSFAGSPDDAENNVKQFLEECVFLLCDGWCVNFKYFTVKPHVSGGWEDKDEAPDRKKHPIRFSYSTLKALRDLADKITVDVDNIMDVAAYIDKVEDTESETVNETLTPGGVIVIEGHKIKVAGSKNSVGVWLRNPEGSILLKFAAKPIENNPSRIVVKMPTIVEPGKYNLLVMTQFTETGKTELKKVREITCPHLFTVAPASTPSAEGTVPPSA